MGRVLTILAIMALTALPLIGQAPPAGQGGRQGGPPPMPMGFFISSTPLNGGNLGGLAGADKHCQTLAAAAGAGSREWRAYLSTQGAGAVNARDRIGSGPWANAKGQVVAKSVDDLHSDMNNINKQTALTEKGGTINGVGDQPNQHDILTGSNADGTLQMGDAPCGNWTSADMGGAMLGHVDRMGRGAAAASWNASHMSKGCSQQNLIGTGGNGYFYCFAQ